MALSKPLLIAGAVTTAGLVGLVGMTSVSAETGTRQTSLVDKIAQKFNLNKDEVKQVFEEERQERMAEHEQRMQQRLNEAVKSGELTQGQADKLKAKHEEMKIFMESLKDKSEGERHEAVKSKMDEMRQWAKDNNIPEGFLQLHMKHGGPRA